MVNKKVYLILIPFIKYKNIRKKAKKPLDKLTILVIICI